MSRAVELSAILLVSASLACAEEPKPVWLAVSDSSTEVTSALKVLRQLRPSFPNAAIIASEDCANLAPGRYVTAPNMSADRASADAAIAQAKALVPDSYLRKCVPRANSRVSLNVPLIDPSIEKVPEELVNWDDSDRLSEVRPLAGGRHVWLRRYYVSDPEDPREGRRTSVAIFVDTPKEAKSLSEDCTDPDIASKAQLIALSCARESAAENLLHELTLYDAESGKKVLNVPRCRSPKWVSASELTCAAEEVDSKGVLHLKKKRLAIPR